MEQKICQSCAMPLTSEDMFATERDGSKNEDYCKWCYADGTYTYSDMDKLIDVCLPHMVNDNFIEEQTRIWFFTRRGRIVAM